MKVVAILGGLGSQMMKFAFYIKMKELVHDEDVYIDTTFFLQNKCWNGFELKRIFNINEKDFVELYSDTERKQLLKGETPKKNYYESALNKMSELNSKERIYYIYRGRKRLYFSENCFAKKIYNEINKIYTKLYFVYNRYFNSEYERSCEAGQGNYLDRYTKNYNTAGENIYYDEFNHVSDRYFSGIREKLQEIFKFPEFKEEKNITLVEEMKASNSVAVHVRLTDHMYDNGTLIENGYYKKAVAYIKDNIEEPFFYIFADDYNWCSENMNILGLNENDSFKFITWNRNEESYRDMQLMTYCKHNILAISSFSWWGYYLSQYANKIVCAPKGYWLEVKNHF